MLKSIRKSRQSGFTLVELGIVLALIGIGLFFAISKMQETGDASRAQNVANDISTTVNNIQRFYNTVQEFPSPINQAELISNKVVPAKWVATTPSTTPGATPTSVITGPFGGAVTIKRDDTLTSEASIQIENVPSRVCSEMGRLMADGYRAITVESTPVKAVNGSLDISKLGTECSKAVAVSMTFRFQKA